MLTFMDIATFFGVCVWLVPLFLFLSLSANDNALPVSQSMEFSILRSEKDARLIVFFVSR